MDWVFWYYFFQLAPSTTSTGVKKFSVNASQSVSFTVSASQS